MKQLQQKMNLMATRSSENQTHFKRQSLCYLTNIVPDLLEISFEEEVNAYGIVMTIFIAALVLLGNLKEEAP